MNAKKPAPATEAATADELEDLVASADTGARSPAGPAGRLIIWVCFAWACFQVWIASPLPYLVADIIPVLNNTHTRAIHLAFALFLTFLAFPAFKRSPRDHIPPADWAFALIAAGSAMYLSVFAAGIADRPGLPNTADLVVSGIGLVVLLEATRRALGPPLMIVAAVFLAYVFFGHLAPEVIAWKGASFSRAMSHMWLTQEGVFGIALGVSTSMVFLFVLFGALLETAGAGNYFIRVAFALLGHMRGGPAKAAVVSSAMTGLISGSSIANVVTTGTFTIPLMKKVGFSAEKAGAVEVASSTNGQLTPPVMGAAAFLIIEYVGISYIEVVKHAFLPAIISYIALVYMVHLEACKAGMTGLPRRTESNFMRSMISFVMTIIGIIILSGVVYYGLGWIKTVAGDATLYVASGLLFIVYVGLLKFASRYPELEKIEQIDELPEPGPTIKAGLYYLLPIVVLVWCLTVERLSPALSAFWAVAALIFIVFTQHFIKDLLRGEFNLVEGLSRGLADWYDGMVAGARNMIGIGVATAAAGIIVGAVSLSGIGQVMTEFVELISGGNLILILIFTAVICLVLGMGLPTTANYIVVATLMAPVIVSLGAANGLIVPLIAVHMFVFYFGILADDTPPVGLAAFAAAAISGGDPIRTGIQGFIYDIRTGILPFMFIFNTQLLMIGIGNSIEFVIVVAAAVVAMLVFAAATQGFFITRSRIWESLALLLVAFTMFRPGFWMDQVAPPLTSVAPAKIYEVAEALPDKAQIRVRVVGTDLEDRPVDRTVMLPVGPKAAGKERISKSAGLELREDNGKMIIDNVVFGSPAEKQKLDLDWEVASVQVATSRPPKQLFLLPALFLLGLIYWLQRRRRDKLAATAQAAS